MRKVKDTKDTKDITYIEETTECNLDDIKEMLNRYKGENNNGYWLTFDGNDAFYIELQKLVERFGYNFIKLSTSTDRCIPKKTTITLEKDWDKASGYLY